MVLAGDNSTAPVAATSPIPWSIATLVAPLMPHFKFVDWPILISDGVALKRIIAGGSGRQAIVEQSNRRARLHNIAIYLPGLVFMTVCILKSVRLYTQPRQNRMPPHFPRLTVLRDLVGWIARWLARMPVVRPVEYCVSAHHVIEHTYQIWL